MTKPGSAEAGDRATSSAVLGVFAILFATVCWGSAGVMVKWADLPGPTLAFWRLLLVAGIFAGLAVATGRRLTWTIVRRSIPGGMLFGTNLAVWFDALRYTTVGIATVFVALVPVAMLVVGNRFFGERITMLAVGCATGAVAGVVLFVVPGFTATGTTTRGVVLSVLALVIWVAYLLASKQARTGVGTIEYLLCMSAIAALSLVPYLLVFTDEGLRPPDHGWGWLVALALVPGCLGHGLLAWAQAHVPVSTAGILLQGETIGAALAGALFLDEPLGFLQILGLAVTTAALAVLTRSTTARPRDQQPGSDRAGRRLWPARRRAGIVA